MRAEIRAQQRAAERRRHAVVAALVGVVLLTTSVIVFWPDDSRWRDQPLVSGLIPVTPDEAWTQGPPGGWWRVSGRNGQTPSSSAEPAGPVLPADRATASPTWIPPTTGAATAPVETTSTAVPTKPNGSPMPTQANKRKPRPTPSLP